NGPENADIADTHEYISHALAAPLVPGETYAVEFFVNLADISKYTVTDIGALLSVQQPQRPDMLAITAVPQVTNTDPGALDDTIDWMRIHGCFTADSAYAYITIGNFHAGAATLYEEVFPTWSASWYSYYFVDDVSVQHLPRPALGPDLTICDATTIRVLDPLPDASYLGSTGAAGTSITVDAAGTYSVQLADAGCPLSDTIVISTGTPVTFALPADTLVDLCSSPRVVLDAKPQPPTAQVLWSTGETTAQVVVDEAGTYVIHASAAEHCNASASITVIDTCRSPVYAPDAFTPNGDGINDQWRPVWSANPGATLQWSIYDRWGQLLFTGAGSDAWDGTAAGTLVPNGTYAWKGLAKDPATETRREIGGQVVVVR
ncbi:MAG TPA: gliding motility-associated C-terminal domain-containing protein, partial [Flavobacteriales bacterium]|nr:gliding motility-associated C-terminal domain-containing protein [Flavobacteriales bacterium]